MMSCTDDEITVAEAAYLFRVLRDPVGATFLIIGTPHETMFRRLCTLGYMTMKGKLFELTDKGRHAALNLPPPLDEDDYG